MRCVLGKTAKLLIIEKEDQACNNVNCQQCFSHKIVAFENNQFSVSDKFTRLRVYIILCSYSLRSASRSLEHGLSGLNYWHIMNISPMLFQEV